MKFFISGKDGRIGRLISQKLYNKNAKVIKLSRREILNKNTLESFFNLNKISKNDWLIISHGKIPNILNSYKKNQDFLYESNVKSVVKLVEQFLLNKGKNIIFISTLSVYNQKSNHLFINKETVERPIGPYGKSKLECELSLIKLFFEYKGHRLIILRTPRIIIGFFQTLKLFIGQIANIILSNFLNIFITRPYISPKNFFESFSNMIDNYKNKFGVFIIIPNNLSQLGISEKNNNIEFFSKILEKKYIKKSIFVEPFVKK